MGEVVVLYGLPVLQFLAVQDEFPLLSEGELPEEKILVGLFVFEIGDEKFLVFACD